MTGARRPRLQPNGQQAYKGIPIREGGRVRRPCGWSWVPQANAGQFGRLAPLEATGDHQRVAVIDGFLLYYSGWVPMYAELLGPLHKMLQVGKFDLRKGSKRKLAWSTEAEETFETL